MKSSCSNLKVEGLEDKSTCYVRLIKISNKPLYDTNQHNHIFPLKMPECMERQTKLHPRPKLHNNLVQ
jgi:hypothetical protein